MFIARACVALICVDCPKKLLQRNPEMPPAAMTDDMMIYFAPSDRARKCYVFPFALGWFVKQLHTGENLEEFRDLVSLPCTSEDLTHVFVCVLGNS